MNSSGNQNAADCDAVEIGTVWNFCAVELEEEEPTTTTTVGTQLMHSRNYLGKGTRGISLSNKFKVLATD